MPEAVSEGNASPCARCKSHEWTIKVRLEHLCRPCFTKYVSTKVIKRIEANKIRAGFHEPIKKVLIPVSLGASSLSLLHILDAHLQKRASEGRHVGYTVHLLFIDESSLSFDDDIQTRISLLQQELPSYDLTVLPLQECFEYGISFDYLVDKPGDETIEKPMQDTQRLQHIFAPTTSPSSQADLLEVLRRRLIESYAQQHGHSNIFYGDTTTRLAERALAETAKGRGGTLPLVTIDGRSGGQVTSIYPLRDLLRKELQAYIEVASPPLNALPRQLDSSKAPTSLKDCSIDTLMRQYIASVEEDYPSIVANIVRTTSKLKDPEMTPRHYLCEMCQAPCAGNSFATTSNSRAKEMDQLRTIAKLCYGCQITLGAQSKTTQDLR